MWHCDICSKPFINASTHKRHVSYCRRNQNRPRVRPRSCSSCNTAKAKCTFHSPCRRCVTKGLDCVYESHHYTVTTLEDSEDLPIALEPVLDLTSENSNSLNLDFANQDNHRIYEDFGYPHVAGDTRASFMGMNLAGNNFINTPSTSQSVAVDTWKWPYTVIQPHLGDALQAPWSTWTNNIEGTYNQYTLNPEDRLSLTPNNCLALLQSSIEVVQHKTNLVVQALRSYPLMMLRRETFPPFIHSHWHHQRTPALPEPISNCMSIAHMYAFRTEETKPFLWRTIKAEHERFRQQRKILTSQDLLAAIQAQIIYMIMRFVDGASEPVEINQQLVITYQLLRKQFIKICANKFCEVDQFLPRPSWEEWIFAESRRRTACLYFLLYHCVSVDTGLAHCKMVGGFGKLPLSSPKTLWEARSPMDWESEYSIYSNGQETGFQTLEMLIDAYKRNHGPTSTQLMDYWNSRTDNLGNLLTIMASIA